MMMYGYGMSGWMWLWGAALILGVLLLIGGLVWAMVATPTSRRPIAAQPGPSGGVPPARQILDDRYARGELGTEEYQERVHTLGG